MKAYKLGLDIAFEVVESIGELEVLSLFCYLLVSSFFAQVDRELFSFLSLVFSESGLS